MPADDHSRDNPATRGGSEPAPPEQTSTAVFQRTGGRRLDVVFGLVGTFMQVGSGLVMLPAAASMLSPPALTFWYVFLTIQTLALLIEFGFTPTLSRNFTYVLSGAQALQTEGVPPAGKGTVNAPLLANLLRASQRLYLGMALIVFVALGVGGTAYLIALSRTTTDIAHIWTAWGVFIAALAVQTAFNWQGAIMVGADRMRENYQVFALARFLQVALSVGGLFLFHSVLTLSIAYAISVIVGVTHARLVIRDVMKRVAHVPADTKAANGILRLILPTASKLGWVTVGEFFTNRFALFAVSLAVGAAAAAEYAVTMQVMMVILTVAQIGTSLSIPRLAAARLARDMDAMRELYAFCIVLSVTMLACASGAFIVLGEPLLRLIGSETLLPPVPVLILLAVIYTITVNAHTAMNVIVTGNQVPHLRAVLLTGAATTIGVIVVALMKGDLFAFVAVQGVTQLAFNFWRWPLYAFRETGLTVRTLYSSAIAGARRVVLGTA